MGYDLIRLLWATTTTAGELGRIRVELANKVAVGVVLASHGYPNAARKGDPIEIDFEKLTAAGILVFQGGTAEKDKRLVTGGGRVMTLVAVRDTYREAREHVYQYGVPCVHFSGMQFRDDIAASVVEAA